VPFLLLDKYKGKFMSSNFEKLLGLPATTSEETTQITPDVQSETTTETQEPETSPETAKETDNKAETDTNETTNTEKNDESTPEGIAKALKDTKSALTKLQQEKADREKADTEKAKADAEKSKAEADAKLQSEIKNVSETEKKLNSEEKAAKDSWDIWKEKSLENYSKNPAHPDFQGMNLTQLVKSLDAFIKDKTNAITAEFSQKKQELKIAESNLFTQTIEQNYKKAEDLLGEDIKNPIYKDLWEGIKALKEANPHFIVKDIFPLVKKAIKDNQEMLSKEFAENQKREQTKKTQPQLDGSHPAPGGKDEGNFMKLLYQR